MYKSVVLNFPTLNDLIMHMYEHMYDDVATVNENGSIGYYINDVGDIYIGTYLFSGNYIVKLKDFSATNIYCSDTCTRIFDETEINKTDYKFISTNKISYDDFNKWLNFLVTWCGEYGDNVLTIDHVDPNIWYIKYRCD